MRKRLMFALGGAVVGILLAAPIQDSLQLNTGVALFLCATGGLLIGVVVSSLMDAFNHTPDETA